MRRDTDAVVVNNKLGLSPKRLGGKDDGRLRSPIAGSVLEQLAQNKDRLFFIGIDGAVHIFHLYPNTVLDQ